MLNSDLYDDLIRHRNNDVFVEATIVTTDGSSTGIRLKPTKVRYDAQSDTIVIEATQRYG